MLVWYTCGVKSKQSCWSENPDPRGQTNWLLTSSWRGHADWFWAAFFHSSSFLKKTWNSILYSTANIFSRAKRDFLSYETRFSQRETSSSVNFAFVPIILSLALKRPALADCSGLFSVAILVLASSDKRSRAKQIEGVTSATLDHWRVRTRNTEAAQLSGPKPQYWLLAQLLCSKGKSTKILRFSSPPKMTKY